MGGSYPLVIVLVNNIIMSEANRYIDKMLDDYSTGQGIKDLYKEWAKEYDSNMVEIKYRAAHLVAQAFLQLKLSSSFRILDVGAGSGIIAEEIKAKGYTNIDALDGSTDMLGRQSRRTCTKTITTPCSA